jgi:hypothetical protein
MSSEAVIEAMREAARAVRSASDTDCVRAIQAAQDALDAEKARRIAAIAASGAYESEGSSTVAAWARLQLRVSAKQARTLARGAATMDSLPDVGTAAHNGEIRAEHVEVFTYGIKHIGFEVILQSQDWLLDVARHNEPSELFRVIKSLRAALYPDDLDEAWIKGMERQDFQVQAVDGGYHVTGFLNITAGAKLQQVLNSMSAPRDAEDQRTGAERRVQAIEDLADSVLAHGLPSDKGFRPQIHITAEADAVEAAVNRSNSKHIATAQPHQPAALTGYGHIGPALLSLFLCSADATGVLTHVNREQSQVLNVGRTKRLATPKQRIAILARQQGRCAAPGCTHTHLEIHHVIWWKDGNGPTDLDAMVGLCSKCHHLVHQNRLKITGDGIGGFTFTNQDGHALRRQHRHRAAVHREKAAIIKTANMVRHRRQQRDQLLRT